MAENSYEQLDDLFKEIKLRLARLRQNDPISIDELKGLVAQLELWFDSLVIDSLRLRRLESLVQRTAELANSLRERLDGEYRGRRDRTIRDIAKMLYEDIDTTMDRQSER